MRSVWWLALLVGCYTSSSTIPPASPTPNRGPIYRAPVLTASEILLAMSDAYANATSYVDHGKVTTVFELTQPGVFTLARPVDIAFVRDGAFRYEFRRAFDSFVVWSDGTSTLTEWSVQPGIKTVADLGLALASATGISGGSAHVTPRLLELVRGTSVAELPDPRLDGVETIDGHRCWKVTSDVGKTTVWIDETSKLLRKRVTTGVLASGTRVDETTVYDPTINTPVSPDLLKPPS
jgi:hypothetical protein